jgi:hypothetical protein
VAAIGPARVRDRRRATGLHPTPPGSGSPSRVPQLSQPRGDVARTRPRGPRVAPMSWVAMRWMRYLRGRALGQLWLDVRWRSPVGAEETSSPTRSSHPPQGLPRPAKLYQAGWRSCRSCGIRRIDTRPLRGAGPRAGGAAPIGYHRQPVTIIHEDGRSTSRAVHRPPDCRGGTGGDATSHVNRGERAPDDGRRFPAGRRASAGMRSSTTTGWSGSGSTPTPAPGSKSRRRRLSAVRGAAAIGSRSTTAGLEMGSTRGGVATS